MSDPDVYGVSHNGADGFVSVFNGQKKYVDTLANFQLDFNTTMPALPAGAFSRVYEQGIRHPIMGHGSIVDGGPVPWALGDNWIANIDVGLANQAARQPPPAPGSLGAKYALGNPQASPNDGGSSP